jgi:hypothetical protein
MNGRDYRMWTTICITVESGRVVKETPPGGPQDLIGKTLDDVSQWVRLNGGDIYPIGGHRHTCCDGDWHPDLPCAACASPRGSTNGAYGVVVKRAAPVAEGISCSEIVERVRERLKCG